MYLSVCMYMMHAYVYTQAYIYLIMYVIESRECHAYERVMSRTDIAEPAFMLDRVESASRVYARDSTASTPIRNTTPNKIGMQGLSHPRTPTTHSNAPSRSIVCVMCAYVRASASDAVRVLCDCVSRCQSLCVCVNHVCDMAHSHTWHDAFMFVPWLSDVSVMCVTCLIQACVMTHSYEIHVRILSTQGQPI